MAGTRTRIDHVTYLKRSFALGLALFVAAEAAEPLQRLAGVGVPGWEHSLLGLLAALGLVVAFFSPFVFGIALPLTE